MKQWKNKAVVWGSLLLFCGCSPTFFSMKSALMQIEKGMDKAQVVKLMGEPDLRRFMEEVEQWEYIRPGSNSTNNHAIIDFENGKVISLDTYNQGAQAPRPVPPMHVEVAPGPPIHQGNLLSNDAYTALCHRVKQEAFKDDKLQLIRAASIKRKFTCAQSAGLMSLFDFDDERMKVLSILCPLIIDRENYKQIINVLSFLSSQDKAKEMLLRP